LNKWPVRRLNDWQVRANAELDMCDKCLELDGKIEHYQRISASLTDQLTLDRIKEMVEKMKAQKAALHPEQEK
jgi:FAD/FMN-containing dehydrogenase